MDGPSLDGRPRVADFGIADYLRIDDDREQARGRRPGTPEYMAPERLRGHRGDARSDQYSFCAALWSGLHGSRPYRGKTAIELLAAIEAGAIHPRVLDPAVPRWLTEVVRKGLAEDPDQRYRDMSELLRALKDEPPDQSATDDPFGADDDSIAHEGRVLHSPATGPDAAARRGRWLYVAIGWASAMLVVLGFHVVTRSLAPEPLPVAEAIESDPHALIFAAIDEDDFVAVERLWNEHKSALTDAQSLAIAEACLSRAKELEVTDAIAHDAAWAALRMARTVERFGSDAKARKEGGEVASDAWTVLELSRPKGADVRGLDRQAQRQSSHPPRGTFTYSSGRLFHVFGCGS